MLLHKGLEALEFLIVIRGSGQGEDLAGGRDAYLLIILNGGFGHRGVESFQVFLSYRDRLAAICYSSALSVTSGVASDEASGKVASYINYVKYSSSG